MAMPNSKQFPPSFIWGCSTAAYQVEGAAREDGRGESIWDTYSHRPGRIRMDHTGDVAVDQYHRYRDDVQLMKWLGIKAHRFSISWPRVQPNGEGAVNEEGMEYYDRFIDELLRAGVDPWPTLFHWDLPQALEDKYRGWESRETAERFADYVAIVSKRISDRVKNFFTINEFGCFTDNGYALGTMAPGKTLGARERNRVRHNALLAHGEAVQALRANAKQKVRVGLAENPLVCVPIMEMPEHIAAARTAMRELNAPFLTTVLEGKYLQTYLDAQAQDAPEFSEDDMRTIGEPLDFVGLNMYSPTFIRAAGAAEERQRISPQRTQRAQRQKEPQRPEEQRQAFEVVPLPTGYPRLDLPWLSVGPQIAYWGPRWMKEIWGVEHVVISENGAACQDQLTSSGEVLDLDRVQYLRAHLSAAARAVAEGYPLKGYFHWSLLDNFEWSWGFTKRFGLFYVNYSTLERTAKLSAHYYRSVVQQGRVV